MVTSWDRTWYSTHSKRDAAFVKKNTPVSDNWRSWFSKNQEEDYSAYRELLGAKLDEKSENWVKESFMKRILEGQPPLFLWLARQGKGKSFGAMRLCEQGTKWIRELGDLHQSAGKHYDLRDARFDIDTIYFDLSRLPFDLALPTKGGLPYGSSVLIDEPIGVDSQTWQNRLQKLIRATVTTGRTSFKVVHVCSPHFNQIMYSIREQFDPIVGEMQEPGVIKFFSIQSHLDKTWWHFLRQVGGKDPATGEFHRVPLPDSKQLIKQYLQKKDYYFDLQMTRQQQEVTAMNIDTPYKPFQPEAKT